MKRYIQGNSTEGFEKALADLMDIAECSGADSKRSQPSLVSLLPNPSRP